MIRFQNGGILIQSASELPNLSGAKNLYVDFETSSGDPKKTSLNPWHDCTPCGTCITVDEINQAWYIPWRTVDHKEWLQDLFNHCHRWINHNVKYDAHVAANAGIIGLDQVTLVDTVTLAKIIDSDRVTRGGYSLSALSQGWLKHDVSGFEDRLAAFLEGCKSKDYGDVPDDIIAEYGCQDVFTARDLWRYLNRMRHDQCEAVWDNEIKLTGVLFDIEQYGLRTEEEELIVEEYVSTAQLLQWEQWLHESAGVPIRPHVNADCFEFLCGMNGLPVLNYTEKDNNPSFDAKTLGSYLQHPIVRADKELNETVKRMMECRKLSTYLSLFVKPFREKSIDGTLHSSYNQAVRTGRMSCKDPNAQQLNTKAKRLIHPRKGNAFLSIDNSQVEFRFIVHFLRNLNALVSYQKNPDTDFHSWVSKMCGIPRKPAKNINFAIAFGGGKGKILQMLSTNMDLMGNLMEAASGDIRRFEYLCKQRGESVYNQYHEALPELKRVTRLASKTLVQNGYVRNAYGRHRHLPEKASWRAFNTVIQSSAADLAKEQMVNTSQRYNPRMKELSVTQVAAVHDEILFEGNKEVLTQECQKISEVMERSSIQIRVPIRVDLGISDLNWADCGETLNRIDRNDRQSTD